MADYKTRTSCRICNGILVPVVDLGSSPLADAFVTEGQIEKSFPLRVSVCQDWDLVQMIDEVDRDLLFNNDYGFFTGASPSSITYFQDYAESVMESYPSDGLHLEIAGNDGTLLKYFKEKGKNVLNVDPAGNTVDVAVKNGVDSVVAHFDSQTAKTILESHGQSSVIMANNVVAHVPDLHDFMASVETLLTEDGVFIAEVQYFPHLLFNNSFDHIYHEHRSFFSLTPLMKLYQVHGLNIIDVKEADTQGGSIRVYAVKSPFIPQSQNVRDLLNFEIRMGLTDLVTYQGFQQRIIYIKERLVSTLQKLKSEGKTVYGFGASAKGNTLLNFCKIGPDLLPYVTDLTPFKIGKLTPGMHIPVVHPSGVQQPDYYLVLVWNYLPGILSRERLYMASGGHFIVPIPTPQIL